MSSDHRMAPVTRSVLTPGMFVLLGLSATGFGLGVYRFLFGLGAATNLSNQYPWGIWIGIDVATGVALAAGGFTTAALTHVFHAHRYETVVRPALLTAVLGYTFVVLGLLVDLGRYYNIWHPMLPGMWQGNSVLFEVAMCVMAYLTVLYIEFLPLVCERFIGNVRLPKPLSRLNEFVDGLLRLAQRLLTKVMFLFIIAGVVLSCMHQSSLGALMLVARYKMNPLWYTPILPLLFLLSAVTVGFAMVIFESSWSARALKRKPETEVLASLSRFLVVFLGLYFAAKVSDMLIRESYRNLFEGGTAPYLFGLELGLGALLPLVMLATDRVRRSPLLLFAASALVVAGVALNRINVFLTAYRPPYATTPYFPSVSEILITVGMVAGLVLLYRVAIAVFPILPSETESPASVQENAREVLDACAEPCVLS